MIAELKTVFAPSTWAPKVPSSLAAPCTDVAVAISLVSSDNAVAFAVAASILTFASPSTEMFSVNVSLPTLT